MTGRRRDAYSAEEERSPTPGGLQPRAAQPTYMPANRLMADGAGAILHHIGLVKIVGAFVLLEMTGLAVLVDLI